MKRGLGFFLVVTVIGAIIGSLLGEILGMLIPSGPLHHLFSTGPDFGFSAATISLIFLDLTLGMKVHGNLLTVIGMIMAFLFFRKR